MSSAIVEFSDKTHCGNDFYNFVNESWLDGVTIPDDYQRWGTFQELEKNNFLKLKKILDEYKPNENINLHKVRLLYVQLNDMTLRTNLKNLNQINKLVEQINHAQTFHELFELAVVFDTEFGINSPINFTIQSGFSNADVNILHLTSGGLGLPDRDYYFLESKQEIRTSYIKFIETYSKCFNVNLDAQNIFNLEKQLADKSFTRVQNRNTELTNNLTDFNQFVSANGNLMYLKKIFEQANKSPGQVNISNTHYMQSFNKLIKSIDLNLWKQYFIFHLILEFSYCFSENIEQEYFNFYYGVLKGTKTLRPQWERTIENLNNIIGELIGLEYANLYFKPGAKLLAQEIVDLIKGELKDYLTNNEWMEPETKTKALEKLAKMRTKIGYPDHIQKNYLELMVSDTNTIFENIVITKKFSNKYILMSLYEKIDRSLWFMNAHAVNAYYSPNMNEIVFPAGILQEPFFSPKQDIAYNFGGFGMVVGHEITHGFDDEGSKYDANGNLNNWWTQNDFKKYKEKTNQIVKQYNNYQINGQNVNGELTLGENIADIGGLALSLRAFKKYNQCLLNTNRIKINYNNLNLSDEQKFFVNFANIWKSKARLEDVQQRIILDVHSPPIFRVNGSIRNITEFYQAFNIKFTDKLYLKPEERVKIWG